MRGFFSPLRMSTAGLWMVPADTTTACLARTIADSPSRDLTSAPMQCRRLEVGVQRSRSCFVGVGASGEDAKRRRSTVVSMRNCAPYSAASRSQVTVPPCFSP